jgi:hypothetical protein
MWSGDNPKNHGSRTSDRTSSSLHLSSPVHNSLANIGRQIDTTPAFGLGAALSHWQAIALSVIPPLGT